MEEQQKGKGRKMEHKSENRKIANLPSLSRRSDVTTKIRSQITNTGNLRDKRDISSANRMDLDEGRNASGGWEKEEKEQREEEEEEEEEEPGIEGERETQRRDEKNREVARKAKRSTPISTYSPAYISEPIYQWEVREEGRSLTCTS
ncbi:conserved Plasmodium protein, unknown function [Plasmodium ovale curtisi]|uniref:Uncharacterized protein n=1 Tax=Plasmodium ovale curtisi TaxID=864141 RepID=A0A1A8WBM1_PLAOA|nr:conserved Plasmodium protein, unknown function [Plasmodium ovale curtisi]